MQRNLSDPEFEAIRAVVTQTRRGRLFLEEYVRRRRLEDAARALAAAERFGAGAAGDLPAAALRLAEALADLRPFAEAFPSPAPPRSRGASGLERRFAALVELGDDEPTEARRIG